MREGERGVASRSSEEAGAYTLYLRALGHVIAHMCTVVRPAATCNRRSVSPAVQFTRCVAVRTVLRKVSGRDTRADGCQYFLSQPRPPGGPARRFAVGRETANGPRRGYPPVVPGFDDPLVPAPGGPSFPGSRHRHWFERKSASVGSRGHQERPDARPSEAGPEWGHSWRVSADPAGADACRRKYPCSGQYPWSYSRAR